MVDMSLMDVHNKALDEMRKVEALNIAIREVCTPRQRSRIRKRYRDILQQKREEDDAS